jgi:co-chaperonin GroES (HSP10)
MNFTPVHRYILVAGTDPQEEKKDFMVLVPEDHKPRSDNFTRVKVLKIPETCTIPASVGDDLVLREAMIEELTLGDNTFYLVLENHVMGVIKNEETIL